VMLRSALGGWIIVAHAASFGVGPGSGVFAADTWTVLVIVDNSGVVNLTRTVTVIVLLAPAARDVIVQVSEPPVSPAAHAAPASLLRRRNVLPPSIVSETTVVVTSLGPLFDVVIV